MLFFFQIPATIEDPNVFQEVIKALKKLGYALTVPDPQLS